MICPNIVASMATTRITFGAQHELWIDFSSWLRFGIAGMYVIGTLKLEEDCGNIRILCSDATTGPSKYFACLSDIAQDSFKIAFSEEEKKNLQLLDIFKIIRSNVNPYSSHNYHKMVTIEEFEQELGDSYDESSDDET